MTANPFLDPAQLGELYGGASRLANRSSALRRAKTSGPFVPDTIVRLARTHRAETGFVLDIGCGRETSTRALAEISDTTLTFTHVEGRHAGPDDLLYLAALLGNAHGAAWRSTLHRAKLTEPYIFDDGTPSGDALASMLEILRQGAEGPAAFYKDCNLL